MKHPATHNRRDADVKCITGIAQGSAKAVESISIANSGVDAKGIEISKVSTFFTLFVCHIFVRCGYIE